MLEMPAHDPYEVLGIPKTAQTAQIRTAYKKLALKFHPDKIQDESLREQGTVEFQKIQEAYEFISDDSKRIQYDQRIRAAAVAKERMASRGTSGSSGRRSGNCVFEDITPKEYATGPTYESRPPPPSSKSHRAPRDPSPVSADRNQRPSRYSDDDSAYEERRASSRKHANYERRRHHSREPYEKKSSSSSSSKDYVRRERESTRHTKERARETRESTRSSRASNAKVRDRERRRDTSEKLRGTTYAATVEDLTDYSSDSNSDSDGFSDRDREYAPKIREHRRPRPKLRHREANYSSSWETSKMTADIEGACEYMRSKGGMQKRSITPESKPSVVYVSPGGMHREKDSARRSSARPRMPERERERERVDLVDNSSSSSSSRFHSSYNVPTRGSSSSKPSSSSRPIPTLRRAGTVPVASFDTSHVEPIVPRSVKKKGTLFDSGYSSPASSPPIVSSGDFLRPSSRQPKIITPTGPTINTSSSHRRAQSTSPLHRDPVTIQPNTNTRGIPSDMFQELKPSHYQVFPPGQVRYSPRIGTDDIAFGGSAKRPSVFRKASVVS
ncbi:uncharacterized protein GIQ15_01113 [Arthroderma uncinatum]|uniref:uncharacterized protein n=1 Tax=Arthroderma uncinatum TaxID=74035 RepID=UPI00144AE659|nr:uncharacterized protein GIQ15_01113 [Arthroderma uncinatum]KAF3491596.1 hypothetical protein GIQ15_01113 [Arthroderma uncinatum]